MHSTRSIILLFAALVATVHGHGAMVAVTGANGVKAEGMGIVSSTPRDGTTRNPFQQDTSIINDRAIAKGTTGVCGKTLGGGNNDVTANVASAAKAGLPTMADDGTVSMTIHQINGDGAGPYTCELSKDATGTDFTPMKVVTNVPGKNSRSKARATDFPLVAQAPAGTTCTGGPNGDACIVRCRNGAGAGPFGGCAVVGSAGSANSSNTATTAAGAASTAAVDTTSAADATSTDAATDTTSTDATSTGAAAATETSAAAKVADSAVDDEEPAKRSLVERFANHMGYYKRDYSRKRMFPSRIVDSKKRGQWI